MAELTGIEWKCRVPGCERGDVEAVDLWIGGEPVRAYFCPRHGAEYRVDEVRQIDDDRQAVPA